MAAIVSGNEAETASVGLHRWSNCLNYREIEVAAEVHAGFADRMFGLPHDFRLERFHQLETGCQRSPAFFFVYAMSPPTAISSCMKGGTGATLNVLPEVRFRMTPESASTSI
jgi:hypothetical protein